MVSRHRNKKNLPKLSLESMIFSAKSLYMKGGRYADI